MSGVVRAIEFVIDQDERIGETGSVYEIGTPAIKFLLEELSDGTLQVTASVFDNKADGKVDTADIRGIFFHIAGIDNNPAGKTWLQDLRITEVRASDGEPYPKIQGTTLDADGVKSVPGDGNSDNMNGRPLTPYDVGIGIGTSGIGHDDIKSITFILDHAKDNLTLEHLAQQGFGARLTSVGVEGSDRGDSLKLWGTAPSVNPPVVSPPQAGNDDLIEAGDDNDFIHGGSGNDEMQGEGGNDIIYGGTDRGEIAWNPGKGKLNKVLIGDNLYGNDGRDTYRYAKGDGVDMIWDFRPGDDVIELTGYSLKDIQATWVGKVANWIDTPKHNKLALTFSDGGAIVFNDYSGLDTSTATAIKLADGTVLSFAQLISMAGAKPAGLEVNDDRQVALRQYEQRGLGKGQNGYGGNDKDMLLGASDDDNLYGNEGVNGLNGKDGNDQLFGGNTRDTMLGGSGDDIGYGNGGDDLIVGGAGSDRLYGTGGADYIFGDEMPADLTLPQTFASDLKWLLEEKTLVTSVSITLASNVTNVTASGNAAINLTGNQLNNVMAGNAAKNVIKAAQGNDMVSGGYGNDILSGGSGKDVFVFDTKLGTSTTDRKVNFDTLSDFSTRDDTIRLENKIFTKLTKTGTLSKAFFTVGSKAKDKNDFIVYNKSTGVLSYDADGSGSKYKAVEFAQVKKGTPLAYNDLSVI